MTDTSANLALPYLLASKADKHVTFNAAVSQLDVVVYTRVQSRTVPAEPPCPMDGQSWILLACRNGPNWGTFAATSVVVWQDGSWKAVAPLSGWCMG